MLTLYVSRVLDFSISGSDYGNNSFSISSGTGPTIGIEVDSEDALLCHP